MINTKFKITVKIDEDSFKIVVTEATLKQKKELDKFLDSKKKEISDGEKLTNSLNFKLNEFDLNKQILDSKFDLELAKEQKILNKDIQKIKDELKALEDKNNTSNKISDTLEEFHTKRFNLLVSGEDKDTLVNTMAEKNISYAELFNELSVLIKEDKEKK